MAVELIAHTEVGSGGASSIQFTSIPSSYDDLMVSTSLRTSDAGNSRIEVFCRFDLATSVYSYTYLYAFNTSPASARATNRSSLQQAWTNTALSTANTFGSIQFYIPQYANTSNYKQVIIDDAMSNNSTTGGYWTLSLNAGLYRSTSAISTVNLFSGGQPFVQYSTATLYGITKA